MAHLGAYFKKGDRVDHTLLRTLVSTGSAEWDPSAPVTDDDGAYANAQNYLAYGSNDLGLGWPAGDVEIYDLEPAEPPVQVLMQLAGGAAA